MKSSSRFCGVGGACRAERQQLRDSLAAADAPKLDRREIRSRLDVLARDLRSTLSEGAAEAREAMLALLVEDEYGRRRLDVRAGPEAPGGYRLEGQWRIDLPVNEETPAEANPDRRFRRLVAGAGFDRLHMAGHPLVVRMQFSSQEFGRPKKISGNRQ